MDLGLYKNKSTTEILNKLAKTITKLNINNNKLENTRAKSLIKEIDKRTLTKTQRILFNKLFTRFSWI